MTSAETHPHVLFLTFDLPRPHEPGMARPWEELQLFRDLGYQVTVITASAHYLTGEISRPVRFLWRRDVEDGVTFLRTWSPARYRQSSLRRVACYLAFSAIAPLAGLTMRHVGIVFSATDPPFMTPGAYVLAVAHRARLILDERDVFPDTVLALGMSPPRVLVTTLGGWNSWLRRRADRIITVSPGLKRLLSSRGTREERIAIVENFFPDASFAAAVAPHPALGGGGPFVVLYAGGLGQATNIETCLRAAEIVQRDGYADVRFVFLGAGERRDEYVREADSRGLTNVEFRPSVARSEMPSVFAATHVTIHAFPKHPYWRCALSSKILEYLAHGKPVVFAGEGDIPNLLRASGGGIPVPPEDAAGMAAGIEQLHDDPELYRRMSGDAARCVRERFGRDQVRERFAAALAPTQSPA